MNSSVVREARFRDSAHRDEITCGIPDETQRPAVRTRVWAGGDEAAESWSVGWLGSGFHPAVRGVPVDA